MEVGGAQTARLNLIKFLASSEPKIKHFLGYFNDGPLLKEFEKYTQQRIKISGHIFKYDPGAYFQIKKIINKNQIDIIHSGLWAANYFTKLVSIKIKIPAILDLHCKSDLLGKTKTMLDKLLPTSKISKIQNVAVSQTVKKSYNLPNTIVIQNGIDQNHFKFDPKTRAQIRKELGIDQKSFVVGGVGRLEAEKNFSALIENFAALKKQNMSANIFLLIIGNGREKEALVKLTKKFHLENYCKIIPAQKNINKFYNALDCLALTSSTEGLPMVILEAMANGLPVLMPKELAQPELPSCNYFLTGQLPEKLSKLLTIENQNRNSMLNRIFSIEQMADNFLKLYTKLTY